LTSIFSTWACWTNSSSSMICDKMSWIIRDMPMESVGSVAPWARAALIASSMSLRRIGWSPTTATTPSIGSRVPGGGICSFDATDGMGAAVSGAAAESCALTVSRAAVVSCAVTVSRFVVESCATNGAEPSKAAANAAAERRNILIARATRVAGYRVRSRLLLAGVGLGRCRRRAHRDFRGRTILGGGRVVLRLFLGGLIGGGGKRRVVHFPRILGAEQLFDRRRHGDVRRLLRHQLVQVLVGARGGDALAL